jgi:hypothetical protein
MNGIPRGKRIRRSDLIGVAKSGIMMPTSVFIMTRSAIALRRPAASGKPAIATITATFSLGRSSRSLSATAGTRKA